MLRYDNVNKIRRIIYKTSILIMKIINFFLSLCVFILLVNCNRGRDSYSNRLPYFRRKVEEVLDDMLAPTYSSTEDSQSHLVSFLIKNVKEIFKDSENTPVVDIDDNVVQEKEIDAEDIKLLQPTLLFNPTKNYRPTIPQSPMTYYPTAVVIEKSTSVLQPTQTTSSAITDSILDIDINTTIIPLDPSFFTDLTRAPYFNIRNEDYDFRKTAPVSTRYFSPVSKIHKQKHPNHDYDFTKLPTFSIMSSYVPKSDIFERPNHSHDVMLMYDIFTPATGPTKEEEIIIRSDPTIKTGDVMMYENLPVQPMPFALNKKSYETRENLKVQGIPKEGNLYPREFFLGQNPIRTESLDTEDVKVKEVRLYMDPDSFKTESNAYETITFTELTNQTIFPDATVYPVSKRYSNYLKFNENVSDEEEIDADKRIDSRVYNPTDIFVSGSRREPKELKRSCIMCDNVAVGECSSPKNKLISSTVCENEEDFCYSVHTPFGIVHRGCFNANRNITTYVCSCNLCNNIPMSDLPVMFTTKRAWISNVYDLSHAKRLRKSTAKDMMCLQCEVNITSIGHSNENNLCLSGQVSRLPSEICADNQICGIKSIKSQGYVWRGCITSPLYNYYMTLCDSDLCNFDPIVSIYDPD